MIQIFITLCLLATLPAFTADLYLPSLVRISEDFQLSVSITQATVGVYLFFVACSQLVMGFISDAKGRFMLLITMISVLLVGSVICGFSNGGVGLFLGRILQGIGGGGVTVISRACLIDVYPPKELRVISSYYAMTVIMILSIAPVIGGYICQSFGWRYVFLYIVIHGVGVLIIHLLTMKETLPESKRVKLSFQQLKNNFKSVLSSYDFLGLMGLNITAYASIFAWLTVAPVLLQKSLNISPIVFGWSCLVVMMVYAVGALTNSWLFRRLNLYQVLILGLSFMMLSGCLLITQSILNYFNLISVILSIIVMMYGCVLVMNNSFANVFNSVRYASGTASAILGFSRSFVSALMSMLIAYFSEKTPLSIGLSIFFLSFTGFGIYVMMHRYGLVKTNDKAD